MNYLSGIFIIIYIVFIYLKLQNKKKLKANLFFAIIKIKISY